MMPDELPSLQEMISRSHHLEARQPKLVERHEAIMQILAENGTPELVEMLSEGRTELRLGTADPDLDRWEVAALGYLLEARGITIE